MTLTMLAEDGDYFVRRAVAENPNTNPETLAMLAEDGDKAVPEAVAKNPNTPLALLIALSGDEEPWVRRAVAENPNTNPETLAMLAEDGDEGVRSSVAENPNTNPETLAMLAEDGDYFVRSSVAENPNTNPETLAMLAEDGWTSTVAENPNTNPETLAMLAQDEDEEVRSSVAENPNTNPETLAMLAQDEDEEVRSAAVENPNTSPEYFFNGRMVQGIILSPLVLIGKFQVESGFAMVGDPIHLDEWKADNQWKATLDDETNLDDFGEFSFAGAYTTAMDSEMWGDNLGIDRSVVFRTFRDGIFNVYAKISKEGRIIKVVIDLESSDSDLTSGVVLEDIQWISSFGVDSGQATVGDPCYLDQWKTNEGEEWELEGKVGEYSYQGASAATSIDSAGVLGEGKSVVFTTGYGDGSYPVYAVVDENSDGQILKIIIDFSGEDRVATRSGN
jgi:hypothetical protein